MGLDFAVDALYQTGWTMHEPKALPRDPFGRPYPTREEVVRTFAEHGLSLNVRHVQLFDCYRAEWTDAAGNARGAVVGQSADEAAVYALSQVRRQLAPAEGA
ncbi:MAG: hypothetical protein HBSAPP03_00190 [Phycisphaerae bacterium]|nr:MAG: hypothetical protein HBSAPP03_00190 [Phycisphaerae bacterium]